MTRRSTAPADFGALSGCAVELADAFVSLASDIVLVIDEEGRIQSVAQGASKPLAAQAARWVGRPWIDTVTGETRHKIASMLTDIKSSGVARPREVNLVGASDGDVPIAFSALRLGLGGPVLAVGRDLRAVSAIQQRFVDAQQELERGYWRARQAESRYRLLFQVATDAVLTVDADSLRVIEGNHLAARLLGAGAVIAGREVADLFEHSSRGAAREMLHNARASGQPVEVLLRLPNTLAAVAVTAAPFRAEHGLRLLLRLRSAATPQAAGSELNKTLALLVDNTHDGVVVTDSSGRILVANPAFAALVNARSEDDLRGHLIASWIGRVDTDVAALLAGAQGHGIAHLVRSRLRQGVGGGVDINVTAALLVDGEQACVGFTIQRRSAKPELGADLALALAMLDERAGQMNLVELMAESRQLLEDHFRGSALARAQGDPTLAAAMLGIAVDDLLRWQACRTVDEHSAKSN